MTDFLITLFSVIIAFYTGYIVVLIPMWKTLGMSRRAAVFFLTGVTLYLSISLFVCASLFELNTQVLTSLKGLLTIPPLILLAWLCRKQIWQVVFCIAVAFLCGTINPGIQLAEIIRQCAKLYEPILERKNVTLNVTLPDKLPEIFANAGELTQVMFNLMQNAKTHTENGRVTLSAFVAAEAVSVCVTDTGTGIDPELLPCVFERGVSGNDAGTGIGLPICKEIIEAHSGTVEIESAIGKGTAVRFTIPFGKEDGGRGTEQNIIG